MRGRRRTGSAFWSGGRRFGFLRQCINLYINISYIQCTLDIDIELASQKAELIILIRKKDTQQVGSEDQRITDSIVPERQVPRCLYESKDQLRVSHIISRQKGRRYDKVTEKNHTKHGRPKASYKEAVSSFFTLGTAIRRSYMV